MKSALAIIAGVVILVAMPVAAVAAEDEQGTPVRLTPSSSSVTSGSVTAAAASPAGCYGQTDYAHYSPSYTAAVHGRTTCYATVQEAYVNTTLQRDRWWGWQSVASQSKTRTYYRYTPDAAPHWYCKGTNTSTYRGISNHRSKEAGKYYYAYTKSSSNRSFYC